MSESSSHLTWCMATSSQALHMLLRNASSMRNQHLRRPLQPQTQHRRHLDQMLPQLLLLLLLLLLRRLQLLLLVLLLTIRG